MLELLDWWAVTSVLGECLAGLVILSSVLLLVYRDINRANDMKRECDPQTSLRNMLSTTRSQLQKLKQAPQPDTTDSPPGSSPPTDPPLSALVAGHHAPTPKCTSENPAIIKESAPKLSNSVDGRNNSLDGRNDSLDGGNDDEDVVDICDVQQQAVHYRSKPPSEPVEEDPRLILLEQNNESFRAANESLMKQIARLNDELNQMKTSQKKVNTEEAKKPEEDSGMYDDDVDLSRTQSFPSRSDVTRSSAPVSGSYKDRKGMKREPPQGANTIDSDITTLGSELQRTTFQVICVGDSGVGKTSFIRQLCYSQFLKTFHATMGIDFAMRSLLVNGRQVVLQMWDTAGQERYRSLTRQYLRKADAILVMYDVTSESSFKSVRHWIASIEEVTGISSAVVALLGNKADLVDDVSKGRVVTRFHGSQLAAEFGAMFQECSARSGDGVFDSINDLALLLLKRFDVSNQLRNGTLTHGQQIRLKDESRSYKTGRPFCCGL